MIYSLLLVAQLTYFVPPLETPLRSPTPMALRLSDAPLKDVRLGVALSGSEQRFARLRYGEADSVRITAVTDVAEAGEATLYLDLNRDLAISEDERILPIDEGARAWEVSLSAIVRDAQGHPAAEPRRLRFQLNESGSILSAATLGWLEGEAVVGERTLSVRRRDLDLNGFFGDPADQLWIDRDGNGEWAPFGELYSSASFLTLPEAEGRVRYAVRSSRAGHQLLLSEASEVGTIEIGLHSNPGTSSEPDTNGAPGEMRRDVESIQALFVGRDGSVVSVTKHAHPTEVPTGEYRLSLLNIELASDVSSEAPWTFLFTDAFRPAESSWHRIDAGTALSMDPLRTALSLELDIPDELTAIAGGEAFRTQSYLYIGADRLLIRNAYRGDKSWSVRAQLSATVTLFGQADAPLATYSAGFS